MPSSYETLGIEFLYPDNWTVADRAAEDGINGVTFELPLGGFFSIERSNDRESEEQKTSEQELVDAVESSIAADYGEVEREELGCETPGDRSVEFLFYYLDLVIISRLLMMSINDHRFVIQIQADSRAFEENERVFEAIMMQLHSVGS